MSVRINTNIEALNAQRNLSAIGNTFARSVERLSSGLRINRAADDSAGLAISEKLKGQVAGLNQAQRNAQDGVSMVQTAEGALTEVHSMLQRIRELAVEAANSTVSSSDARSIDTEISALREEIDRISKSTTFNGQTLLDGSFGKTATASGLSAITGSLPGGAAIKAGSLVAGAYTLTATASATPGTASTIGGANGLGISNNPAGFSSATAIDDTTNGLLTQTGPSNTISGISGFGNGLSGVTTFNSGTLAVDAYVFQITDPGAAATLGGTNPSWTVDGSTTIDGPGLATSTAPTFFASPKIVDFWANGYGNNTGTLVNQNLTTGGTLAAGDWKLHATGTTSTPCTAATWTLTRGSTVINLTNTGGVLTDAATGFHLDLSGLAGNLQGADPFAITVHLTGGNGATTYTPPTIADFWANGYGNNLGTLNNPLVNSGGRLAGGVWRLATSSSGGLVKDAVYTLTQGSTVIHLDNNQGVLSDATTGFRLDLSGVTGNIQGANPFPIAINMTQYSGVDTSAPENLNVVFADAAGNLTGVALSAGETFQQVADDINNQAAIAGHAQLAATVGDNGLLVTTAGFTANNTAAIKVYGYRNALTGLGLLTPTAGTTTGAGNGSNTHYTLGSTPAVATGTAATATLTDWGPAGQSMLTMTGVNDVFTDAGTGFSIDLSAATGGTLNANGSATLHVGSTPVGVDTTASQHLIFTDETGAQATLSLTTGETFLQLITAINGAGLAMHASFGSGGLKLTSTGTNLAADISVTGSDNALRGVGLQVAGGSAPSTSDVTMAPGTLGTAANPSGGTASITLTGSGAPVALTNSGGVYSDSASGFSIDLSGAASLSSGTATITVAGSVANFQIGANAGDSLGVAFGNSAKTAAGYGNWNADITAYDAAVNAGTGLVAAAQALITSSDTAIGYISTVRGNLGAIENRLQHTTASIAVASENLNASESRIRDLDVAAEMVIFTKTQILQQAGTAILAQANSAPQNILTLLR